MAIGMEEEWNLRFVHIGDCRNPRRCQICETRAPEPENSHAALILSTSVEIQSRYCLFSTSYSQQSPNTHPSQVTYSYRNFFGTSCRWPNGCLQFPVLSQLNSIPPARKDCIRGRINLFQLYLEKHRPWVVMGAWLTVLSYTALILFAAVIFTNEIVTNPEETGEAKVVFAIFYVALFSLGLCCSVLKTFSWIWRGRYSVPLNLRSVEDVELRDIRRNAS